MKADTLKKSILQYAMQGKLVAQDPNDEPASELLRRIKAEKEQLIKEGKIKKEKPLPPITQAEIPYDLPQGWEWVRLGEIGNTQTGTTPPTNNPAYYGESYSFIKPADIGSNGEIVYNKQMLSEEGIKKGKLILKNSIMMVCIGGSIGKVGITNKDCSCNQQINVITPHLTEIVKFLFYCLFSPYFYNTVLTIAPQTTLPIISKSKWEQIIIPLPPLAEQKRIVEKLEEILPLVEEYGKNEEILSEMNQKLPKQIRQSILQYAVQGKLVEQNPQDEPASELLRRIRAEKEKLIKEGKIKKEKPLPPITQDEIPYDLPQGWEWTRLGEVINYGSTGTIDNNNNLDENTWILDLEDIEKESSRLLVKNIIKNKSFNSSKKIFKKGDVLYGKLRPYLDKVIVAEEDGICTTEILPLRIYYGIDSYYLKWFLKSPMFIQYVNQLTYGVKMPRLGTEDGKNALLALPPLAEQKRIVSKVEELMQLVDKLES